MDTPTYSSDGTQIYKPQTGENWRGGLRFRESYGGVIASVNDVVVATGGIPTAYPQNFAGVIAAIADLNDTITEDKLPNIGDYPEGWEFNFDSSGNVIGGTWAVPPKDGELWFDTRQGRLFIANNGEYWQTNGGDGLTHVGDVAPTNPPVIGTTWFDTFNSVLYVYVDDGIWEVVQGAGEASLTTATLPLSISATGTIDYTSTHNYIPPFDLATTNSQKDFNEYTYLSLVALDNALAESAVTVSDTAPTDNVVNGTLWYDGSTLELSIYYDDGTSQQWVPVSVSYPEQSPTPFLVESLATETANREQAVRDIYTAINNIDISSNQSITDIRNDNFSMESRVVQLENNVPDLNPYAKTTDVHAFVTSLQSEIDTLKIDAQQEVDLSSYAETSAVTDLQSALQTQINTRLTTSQVQALMPDVSSFVGNQDITDAINNITVDYLPRTGGVLTGSFQLEKTDYALPSLDFSSQSWYSKNAFKFKSVSATPAYTTFGTTDKDWEYAWNFTSDEDFCWIYNDTEKVFSITKEGPNCSQLYIGDFINDNCELTNKIDVRDRLTKYQTTFESLKQGVASATDFNSLKTNLSTALANL